MKLKFILLPFIILFLTLVSVGAALAAGLQAVPVPKSTFDPRGKYMTDLFTGSGSYSYQIAVPKGTDDLTPDVALSYNSSSAFAPSAIAGMGWELSRDYIELDVNYSPTNTGDDKLRLRFKGGTHDLTYVAADNRYHTKTESNLHITKLAVGEANDSNEYWQVIAADGTKYRFGQSINSELMCEGRSYVYRWYLDQVEDTHGNKIFYTYTENSGASYLSKIEYNSEKARVIDFTYSANSYQRPIYVQGCSINENQRLNTIQVKANASLVRQFDLVYTTTSSGGQLLQSISEKGSNGTALPPTTFEYKPEVKSWATTGVKWLDHADIDAHLQMQTVRLMDMNGDGLSDILRTFGPTWKVLINQGTSWSPTYQTWINNIEHDARLDRPDVDIIDVTGDSLPDIVMANGSDTWRVWRNTGTSFVPNNEVWANLSAWGSDIRLGINRTRLIDVTGDGLPEIVHTWWNAQQEWRVFRNLGNSWSTSPEVWGYGIAENAGLDNTEVAVVDVNGDGLADIVKTSHSGTNATWKVWKNTGQGWSGSPETWIDNANIDAYIGKGEVAMAEVNGDGLVDIVRGDDLGTADRTKVLINKGNSWSTTYETWIDPSANLDLDVHSDHVRIADANGDGLSDIVKGHPDDGSYDTWTIYKNNGYASHLLSKVTTTQGGSLSFDYKASTTYDNTGADSQSDLPFPMWLIDKKTENNGVAGSHGTNDITTYFYQDGLYDWQDKEFRGFETVDENLPNATKKKYVFHQDDVLKGKFKELQIRDSQNNPQAESKQTWSTTVLNGVSLVYLLSEKSYTYDGTATNPKIVQTDYLYDDFGNVTKKSELGDISVTGDERYTYNEYVYNTVSWIINKLAHSTLKASDNSTAVSQLWRYYDNDPAASSSGSSTPPSTSFGDGSDGDLTIFVNTTEAPVDSFVSATVGGITATVAPSLGFTANQIVLLHQTQGTNAGSWEFARVQGYSGATITFTTPLANSYSSSGNNHAQIRLVPQYHNVTVSSGATWSAKAWNGTTGGIFAFLADGTVTLNGGISATGKGFRGANSVSGVNVQGLQGEGTVGLGSGATAANTNGGGGGMGGMQGSYPAAGGAGGGYGVVGANGSVAQGGSAPFAQGGTGGEVSGTATLSTMTLGGSGGSGGTHRTQSATSGAGGAGGGIIFITAAAITNTGNVTSAGSTGNNASGLPSGGGGGGAGGAVFLRAENTAIGSTLVTATGANGGSGTSSGSDIGGAGGTGGVGRIRVEYENSLTGTTNPAANAQQIEIPLLPAPVSGLPGSTTLIKGDLTKEVKWLNGGTNPTTTYSYDSFGNQISMTDANNQTTTTVFDTATHTYPISQTNAKNQTTNVSYDLGTGNLLSQTDPNNLTTSYEYDVFGRISKEIKPYDTSALPSVSYQYFIDGVAPDGILIAKREVSGQAGTLDSYTTTEGFGRKLQTRMDAEDPTKQIVADTFYDTTGEVFRQTVPYLATPSAATTPTPTPAPTAFGNGSNGSITISSNTTETPIDSSVTATAGTTTATVGSGLGFAANQIVLFHQTQGTNTGLWEFARVESYLGTTLTLTTALTNSYSSAGNDHAQVRVVPQYNNVTVNSGVTWAAKAWDGSTGGILAFLANGTVTINGTISSTAKGFRGPPNSSSDQGTGLQGESSIGAGTRTTSSNG